MTTSDFNEKTALRRDFNLPDAFRESFELYSMGYKYKDIAKIMNEPQGTVKSKIQFARKILISQLV